MPLFKYKIIDQLKNTKSGLVEANNEEAAVEALKERGYSVLSIFPEHEGIKRFYIPFVDGVSMKDIVIFSRQFAVMISANVVVVQALRILVDQTENMKLKMIVSEIADEVDSGYRLSDALAKRPQIFSGFYVSVVRSGETSGKLDEVLEYLANELEKDYDLTTKIRGAMIYPAFVLSGLVVVAFVMMIYVVPKLTMILQESKVDLPVSTKILIAASNFASAYWWIVLIAVLASLAVWRSVLRIPKYKAAQDRLVLLLPIFGPLFQKIYLVRFARTMNTLIVGGVTIVDSLKVSAEVAGNIIYRDLVEATISEVEEGNSISVVFAQSPFMPKMVTQMIGVGEKTGKLDVVLDRIVRFYSREIDNTVANLMTLLEPIVMVVMGVAVGIMVAAVILPMYNLASQM